LVAATTYRIEGPREYVNEIVHLRLTTVRYILPWT